MLPEEPDKLDATLGRWLKDQLQKRRNTVRFLLPRAGSTNAFLDRDLLILARAEMKAQEWGSQNPEYRRLHKEFESTLRDNLKKRFDRFAVLSRWNFADPAQCKFSVERLDKQGSQIPEAIEEALTSDLFVPEDFEELVIEFANNNEAVGKLLDNNKSPSRKTGELDNRGSQFYLALYWAQALAAQSGDKELAEHFAPLARALADNEDVIVKELAAAQGNPADIGGYYEPDPEKTSAVMRPSKTLNDALAAAQP